MAEIRSKTTVIKELEKAKQKRERKDVQLTNVNNQYKYARNVFICLGCLLVSVLTMESKNLHGVSPAGAMVITIATLALLVVGWFGSVVFGTKLKASMGGSTTSSFLICFLSFGIYAGFTALFFFQKPYKKELLQEIEDVENEIERLENELKSFDNQN